MTVDVPRPKLPFLHREVSRHGTVRWTVRRNKEPRVYINETYDTPAFWRAYRMAVEGKPAEGRRKAAQVGSVRWVVERYMQSAEWQTELRPSTRAQRSRFLAALTDNFGEIQANAITTDDILEGMDTRKDRPHAANNWLKAMSGLLKWAASRKLIPADPTGGVKRLSGPNDMIGFHTWTDEEVAAFEARWPVGTRERVAFDVLLYTGLRRGDAVIVGRPHVRGGVLRIRTQKTGQSVAIRVLAPLAHTLRAGPIGELTYIATETGRPRNKEGFGNWFRDACKAAGVPGSAHGLRKAGARRAALNGATEAELNAWFGWAEGSRESATYVRGANREKLADRLADRMMFPNPVDQVGDGVKKGE